MATKQQGKSETPGLKKNNMEIGFALGGLAGNNVHGAGLLSAALKNEITPAAISCTSGQIYWVYEYLKARNDANTNNKTFDAKVDDHVQQYYSCGQKDWDLLRLAWQGIPGVMRLSGFEIAGDMWFNAWRSWSELIKKSSNMRQLHDLWDGRKLPFFTEALWGIWPARTMVSLRDNKLFTNIANAFNNEKAINIFFNAYNVRKGREYVYCNRMPDYRPDGKSSRSWVEYRQINATAVENALRLYEYGFNDFPRENGENCIDGAYIREVMLAELADFANIICVAKPMPDNREKDFPRSYIEREDLKTEVMFKGTYALERQRIELINEMRKEFSIDGFCNVTIEEIPFNEPRGYFDYVFEDIDLFRQAKNNAELLFNRLMQPVHGKFSVHAATGS